AMEGVVASIKPVHSLVATVMGNTGRPALIVEGAGSPHTYALKPSQARMLSGAKLVFWIGPGLEAFLEKPLETLSGGARVVALDDVDGLVRLGLREGGTFEAHDHGHGEDGDHDAQAAASEDHGHGHEPFDTHLWLDPRNAVAMGHAIAQALAQADPANAETYFANAAALEVRLRSLEAEISEALAPVRDKPFVVFHDAYHYFENRFALAATGSVTVSPEVRPGAERVAHIHERLASLQETCVFAEPQFEPKILSAITEGTDVRAGTLDPLGAGLPAGPDLYPTLLRDMAREFRHCLGG
ncbi:MAG: zinc ABC transporter substrate-binding protein, partial [Rhodobiaceae bacterium]|nr:zinc ABC transporter substrate-binding protein [Rhodobiaceae bacterium]